MNTAVVAGNLKQKSRTLEAGIIVAKALSGNDPAVVIDAIALGAGLLSWGDALVADAIRAIRSCDLVIFASPTYKATYTGLLKLLLDHIPQDGLKGIVAVPVMLGAGLHHALAPELLLKPVLVELGATCPTKGLYLLDSGYGADGALDAWLELGKTQIFSSLGDTVAA